MKDVGIVESYPKLEGKRLTVVLAPLPNAGKTAGKVVVSKIDDGDKSE